MDCNGAREMLSGYHDGELSASDRARIDAHLRACPDCAALLESIARIDRASEVPDPGREYWDGFNRRVAERIGKEEVRPKAPVLDHPRRGWIRRQLPYLVPAAAAAAMVVAVVRHMGPATAPAPSPAARTAPPVSGQTKAAAPPVAAEREEASKTAPRPAPADERIAEPPRTMAAAPPRSEYAPDRSKAEIGLKAEYPSRAEGKPSPSPASPYSETPAVAKDRTAPPSGEKMDAAAVQAVTESTRPEPAARSKAGLSERSARAACEEARSLAAKGRFREAEAAQRECLARDPSRTNQESGLVFMAELLDRQNRFAEADSVIREAETRFPRNRPLETYRQRRQQVQSGALPPAPEPAR